MFSTRQDLEYDMSQEFYNILDDSIKDNVYFSQISLENIFLFEQQFNTPDFGFLDQFNQPFSMNKNPIEPTSLTSYKNTENHTSLNDLPMMNPKIVSNIEESMSWHQNNQILGQTQDDKERYINLAPPINHTNQSFNANENRHCPGSCLSLPSYEVDNRHQYNDHSITQSKDSSHLMNPQGPDNFCYDQSQWLSMPRLQKLRYDGDLYTPKWVRYTGNLKQGYCDICPSGKWLQLKNSAYWYHKQFFHGISSASGKPFVKPLKEIQGKGDTIEGLCHQCKRFVPAGNIRKRNNYMLWYRHAHKCHLYDKPRNITY